MRAHQTCFPGWSTGEFADCWQTIAQKHLNEYLAGKLTFIERRRERLRELFGLVNVVISDHLADRIFDLYLHHYEASWKLFPEVLAVLDRLEGYPLGIISNGDNEQQRKKLESLGLMPRFAHVLISGELGIAKPDAAIFHEACRRANCSPHECLYVGDRLESDAIASQRRLSWHLARPRRPGFAWRRYSHHLELDRIAEICTQGPGDLASRVVAECQKSVDGIDLTASCAIKGPVAQGETDEPHLDSGPPWARLKP